MRFTGVALFVTFILHTEQATQYFDRPIFRCNFDTPTVGWEACNFTQVPGLGDFSWTLHAGPTDSWSSGPTGPYTDHTYGNATGHYMYTEASGFEPGSNATLWSPTLKVASNSGNGMCLTFWYNMYGRHIGTLNVTQEGTQGSNEVLWSMSGNQSTPWYYTTVTLPADINRVAFVGVRGGDVVGQPYGDIAIDDVIIYDGPCENSSDTTTTMTTTHDRSTAISTRQSTPSGSTSSTLAPVDSATPTQQLGSSTSFGIFPTNSSSSSTTMNSSTTAPSMNSSTTKIIPDLTPTTPGGSTMNNTRQSIPSTSTSSTRAPVVSATSTQQLGSSTSFGPSSTEQLSSSTTVLTPSTAVAPSTSTASELPPVSGASTSDREIMWGLGHNDWIVIVACLCGFSLILIIVVIILACQLCRMRRRSAKYSETYVVNNDDEIPRSFGDSKNSRSAAVVNGRQQGSPDGQSQPDGSRRPSADELTTEEIADNPPDPEYATPNRDKHLEYYNNIKY